MIGKAVYQMLAKFSRHLKLTHQLLQRRLFVSRFARTQANEKGE